jgi:two-component system, response regulator RegA
MANDDPCACDLPSVADKRPASPRLKLALVVEDDPRTQCALTLALASWAVSVVCVSDVSSARRVLAEERPELMLLDVALGDGDAFDVLDDVALLVPQPAVIAVSGSATVQQSFALAQRGVRCYLPKPFTVAALDAAIELSLNHTPELRALICAAVGHRAIHEVESEVRNTMLSEALARTGGNRRGAARLLSVSRQLLQHMLRNDPEVARTADKGAHGA